MRNQRARTAQKIEEIVGFEFDRSDFAKRGIKQHELLRNIAAMVGLEYCGVDATKYEQELLRRITETVAFQRNRKLLGLGERLGNGERESTQRNGTIPSNIGQEPGFHEYYAVAVGRKPGLYSNWDDAKAQVDGYSGCKHKKFKDRGAAIQFMRNHGIPDSEIRLFRKTFQPTPGFTPDPTAPFNDEFRAFAATQSWSQHEMRKAKVRTIVDDLISRYLPAGISPDQEKEDGDVDLTDDQMLQIYQGMCQSAGKPVAMISTSVFWSSNAPPMSTSLTSLTPCGLIRQYTPFLTGTTS